LSANRGDDDIETVIELATGGVRQAGSDQQILFGFVSQTGLAPRPILSTEEL
jgi:hypothetical protein